MEGGYFKLGRFGGAPVRLHWSAPLGAFAFCGFSFVPGAWGAFLLLILMHELGHAFLVRRFGLALVSVDVHGLGGLCQWSGTTTPTRRALIAWGGVFGQAILLVIGLVLRSALPSPHNMYLDQALGCLVMTNLMMMGINLLPIPGFDGAEAWRLFGRNALGGWWRRRRSMKRVETRGVVRQMPPPKRRFISNDIHDDILEKTPTSTKRPPPHMLN